MNWRVCTNCDCDDYCNCCFLYLKNESSVKMIKCLVLLNKDIKYPPFSITENMRIFILQLAKTLVYRYCCEESILWIKSFDLHFLTDFGNLYSKINIKQE